MNKFTYTIFFIVLMCIALPIVFKPIKRMMEQYATTSLYEVFGNAPVSSEVEKKINALAKEMNLSEKFCICKMNTNSMRRWGYHNACACYPSLLCGFIIFNSPHLFISEGFFEDLSIEEQHFIIGHELVHIKEHHLLYLMPIMWFIALFLLGFWWLVIVKYTKNFVRKFDVKYQKKILYTVSTISLFFCLLIPEILEPVCKRRNEREADRQAVRLLKCGEGALKVIDRWSKEYNIPLNNSYCGIFADHPSSSERKEYCLKCH